MAGFDQAQTMGMLDHYEKGINAAPLVSSHLVAEDIGLRALTETQLAKIGHAEDLAKFVEHLVFVDENADDFKITDIPSILRHLYKTKGEDAILQIIKPLTKKLAQEAGTPTEESPLPVPVGLMYMDQVGFMTMLQEAYRVQENPELIGDSIGQSESWKFLSCVLQAIPKVLTEEILLPLVSNDEGVAKIKTFGERMKKQRLFMGSMLLKFFGRPKSEILE